MKYELITQRYVDHLTKYHGSTIGLALEHVVGIYSIPVSSIAEYAAALRKQEHELGHVYLCGELCRILDIEADGEGQYDGDVAGAWAKRLLAVAANYDRGIDRHGDPYWFVKNGDGDWFRLYEYLIDTLQYLATNEETFYIRDLSK